MPFIQTLWVNSGKSSTTTRITNLYILKWYIKGASRTRQYHCFFRGAFFRGARRSSRKLVFLHILQFWSIAASQNKKTKIRTFYISWKTDFCRSVLSETWQKKKEKRKSKIRTLFIFKVLNTGCPTNEVIKLLLSWST